MADDPTFTKADLDKAVKEAVAQAEEGLRSKRDELMDEVKALKAELRKSKDIDPAEVTALEDELAKAKAENAKLAKDAKDALARAEKAEKAVEAEAGYTSRLLTENALNAALAEAGVTNPAFLKTLKATFAGEAAVVAEGDQRIVKLGDKALADAIKEWADTDEAKNFIAAPGSRGGGAPGGSGGGTSGKTMTRAEYNERVVSDPAGMRSFIKDGGQIINEAA